MFGPISDLWWSYVDLVEWFLRQLTDFTGSAGIAIILFTIVLKTVLLPLTVKSIRSTASMQELQPKIKELQKKYAKDRARLSEETMRLYQEYQINPAAGCLPLLIQIPIFFGLYYAVSDLSRATGGEFLWLDSLSEADPLHILPFVAAGFQFIQTMMMRPREAPKITDPQQQMMNTMMMFMPLMVIFFGWTFASGAVLYWATQSVYSVVQQWFITGWGKFGVWMPWLPELPEHRRLGHRKKPLERKEIAGDVEIPGIMGKLQRRAKEMEERRAEQLPATQRSSAGGSSSTSSASGKRGKQARTQPPVGNVSGGANGDDEVDADQPADTRASTRVMSSPSRGSRRARGSGRSS